MFFSNFFLLFVVSYVILLVCLFLGVAFYTLLERQVLGRMHLRRGPNKVSVGGLMQPLADGIKLFLKEDMSPSYTYKLVYWWSPVLGLMIMLSFSYLYPGMFLWGEGKWGVLIFMVISSLGVYPIILAGWSSSSKYSNLGAYRAVAQAISYEVNLSFIVLGMIMYYESFSFSNFLGGTWGYYIFYFSFLILWGSIILVETNRAPFDLPEAESELVSGFNTDYSGGGFALIFIAEYGNMIMMSMITSWILWGGSLLGALLIMYFYLWVRASFPRFRYDYLMYVSWKMILPFVLGFFVVLVGLFFDVL